MRLFLYVSLLALFCFVPFFASDRALVPLFEKANKAETPAPRLDLWALELCKKIKYPELDDVFEKSVIEIRKGSSDKVQRISHVVFDYTIYFEKLSEKIEEHLVFVEIMGKSRNEAKEVLLAYVFLNQLLSTKEIKRKEFSEEQAQAVRGLSAVIQGGSGYIKKQENGKVALSVINDRCPTYPSGSFPYYNFPLNSLQDVVICLSNIMVVYLMNQPTDFLKGFSSFRNLKILECSGSQLKCVPDEIGLCQKLKKLLLNSNQIKDVSGKIGECSNLQELDLDNNRITQLPDTVSDLTNLQELLVANNELTVFPQISGLTKLVSLSLRNNAISTIDPAMIHLPLEEFEIYGNPCVKEQEEEKSLSDEAMQEKISHALPPNFLQAISWRGYKRLLREWYFAPKNPASKENKKILMLLQYRIGCALGLVKGQ